MAIDKFGRSLKSRGESLKGPKGEGFNLTPDGDYDMQNKRLWNVADPEDISNAVNLRTLNKLSMTISKGKYNAQHKQIINLSIPKDPNDAATKAYVENTCEAKLLPLSTNLGLQQADLTSIKTRLAKCEDLVTNNKEYHDRKLRKLGIMVFNYINLKKTGRAAILPEEDKDNWEELFKIPDVEDVSDEDEEEIEEDPGETPNFLLTEAEYNELKPKTTPDGEEARRTGLQN